MTRDEAIKIILEGRQQFAPQAGAAVDAYVKLGMLKLDEPKSVEDRAVDVLKHYAPAPRHVIHDLAVAGLKIVEK